MDKEYQGTEVLTVKEFAAASGRSPQTIYKQVLTRLSGYSSKVGDQWFIQAKALEEVFGISVEQPNQPEVGNSDNRVANPEAPLYDILREELEAKNRQIAQLQADLDAERRHSRALADELLVIAKQAQELHAGTMAKNLLADGAKPADDETADAEIVPEPKKRTVFEKLADVFRRK